MMTMSILNMKWVVVGGIALTGLVAMSMLHTGDATEDSKEQFIALEINKAVANNMENARRQYAEAFKAQVVKIEVKKANCLEQADYYDCKVEYLANEKNKRTQVLLEKAAPGYKLKEPLMID